MTRPLRPALALLLASLAAAPAAPAPRAYPTAGVAFAAPAGWTAALPPSKSKTVALFVPAGAKPGPDGAPAALVTVEAAKPARGADARATAAQQAKDWGGTLDPKTTTLDGTTAYRITAPAASKLGPTVGLVTVHDGLLYLVMGGTSPGAASPDAAVEQVRASWTWVPLDPPVKHLTFGPLPMSFLDAAVQLDVPEHASLHPEDGTDHSFELELYDRRQNRPEFLANVQVLPFPATADVAKVESTLNDGVQKRFRTAEPFRWHKVDGPTRRDVTQPVPIPGGVGGLPTSAAWALVRLDDDRAVLINFTVNVTDAADVKAYQAVMDRMAASVRKP